MTALPAVILLYHRYKDINSWEARHKKISILFSIILLFGSALVIYGAFFEPRFLITNYQNIEIGLTENSINIAIISDLHVGDYNKRKEIKKIAQRIIALKPDIVFIIGDHMLANYKEDDRLEYLRELKIVAENIPTYAVHGNHDYGIGGNDENIQKRYRFPNKSADVKKIMEENGINYLVNDTVKLTINNSEFLLFGGDEYLANKLDFSSLIKMKEEYANIPSIALVHNPTSVYLASQNNTNLLISGHTHGGQVRLPFIGNIMSIESPFPRNWYQGLTSYNNTQLFVTSGVNESSARTRLFNPPEIVLLTIY